MIARYPHGIGAKANESRMAERHHAAVSEYKIETNSGNRQDHQPGEDIQPKTGVDIKRQRRQHDECDQD